MKVSRTYKIEESVIEMLREAAERDFDGNLTAAIESMIYQSHCIRQIDEGCRWAMYSEAKSFNGGFDDKETRTYIDGLCL